MSGKIVKALISATQVPMKNRKGCVALDSGGLKVFAQALTFFPLHYLLCRGAGCIFQGRHCKGYGNLMRSLSPSGGGRGRVSTLEGQTPLLIFEGGRGVVD